MLKAALSKINDWYLPERHYLLLTAVSMMQFIRKLSEFLCWIIFDFFFHKKNP